MLIVDESFMDFVEKPAQTTLEHDIERHPNMVIFKSMSKAYGICGLRIGYMLTANAAFAEAVRKGVHIWNINGFAEEFLRLLPDYRRQFAESCQQVRADRDKLFDNLRAIPGMTVYKPDANFVFCRLPDHAQSGPEITRRLFIEHNMYMAGLIGKLIHQPAERIVVGNGAAELIKIVSGHLASKLIIPVPSFNEYANAAPSGRAVEFALEFPSFHLDVDEFAAEATMVKADVAVVVTPNNPTSMLVPKSDLVGLAQKLAHQNCMLVVDESFMDFVEKPAQTTLEQDIEVG